MDVGVVAHASGSAYVEFNHTKVRRWDTQAATERLRCPLILVRPPTVVTTSQRSLGSAVVACVQANVRKGLAITALPLVGERGAGGLLVIELYYVWAA